jgi:hypothetical protein
MKIFGRGDKLPSRKLFVFSASQFELKCFSTLNSIPESPATLHTKGRQKPAKNLLLCEKVSVSYGLHSRRNGPVNC